MCAASQFLGRSSGWRELVGARATRSPRFTLVAVPLRDASRICARMADSEPADAATEPIVDPWTVSGKIDYGKPPLADVDCIFTYSIQRPLANNLIYRNIFWKIIKTS